jgi:hypothetical protein
MIKGIVDRFEGDYAIIEIDGDTKDFPRTEVSADVSEGDVVDCIEGKWEKNEAETKKRTEEIKKQAEDLWAD